jgi:KDO2-lipid IV(A) lauroyltransferase
MNKKRKKSKLRKLIEYGAVYVLLLSVRAIPMQCKRGISRLLGGLFFHLIKKRREIAINNITAAFGKDKSEKEIKAIARESFSSFFLTFLEIASLQNIFARDDATARVSQLSDGVATLFLKAKNIHDESGGCLFVTPHIGNWEVLPHVSSMVGIPLVFVARPMDNNYLEDLLLKKRTASGQMIIPKRNAFFVLQKTLQSGRSIGMLPDQSTMKGITVDFFGRKATATPVPALLAITHKRPIVVVACCRKKGGKYEGFVCDPIWPGDYESEKAEIFRITTEMTRNMESIIRKYPEQYLWMHNRWKTYKNSKEFLS